MIMVVMMLRDDDYGSDYGMMLIDDDYGSDDVDRWLW